MIEYVPEPIPHELTIHSHVLEPDDLEGARLVLLREKPNDFLDLQPVVHDVKGTPEQVALVTEVARGVLWHYLAWQGPETILTMRIHQLPIAQQHMARLALCATPYMLEELGDFGVEPDARPEVIAGNLVEAMFALVDYGNRALSGSNHMARFAFPGAPRRWLAK